MFRKRKTNMGRSITTDTTIKSSTESIVVANMPMEGQTPEIQQISTRVVHLHGEVNEYSIANVIMQLLYLANQSDLPIQLVISTYGGSIDEMFSLYDTIKFLPCPVHTVALGKVMSAGVLLLAAGVKGKRMIGKHARIMIHPVKGGNEGNIFEQLANVTEMKRLQSQLVASLKKETKMSEKKLQQYMSSGFDVYLSAEEAIDLGVADVLIGG